MRLLHLSLAAAAVAMAVPVCQALAAKEGKQVPIQPIGWLDYGGELYAKAYAKTNNQTSPGATTDEKEWAVEEGVDLNGHGYIYHPNMLEWNLGLRLGGIQESLTVNQSQTNTNSNLLGYNVGASLLKEKPVSLRGFASQNQSVRTHDFAPSTKMDDTRQGGELTTKGEFPAWLLLERLDTSETGDQRDVTRNDMHLKGGISDRRDPDWFTELIYERHDVQETAVFTNTGSAGAITEEIPDQSNEVVLSNTWRFGPGKRSAPARPKDLKKDSTDQPAGKAMDRFGPRLSSDGKKDANQPATQPANQDEEKERHSLNGRIRALDRKGAFSEKDLSIEERMELVHTKTFQTFYEGTYDNDQTDEQTDRYITGEVGFLQKVYDSLDITVKGIGRDRDYGTGTLQAEGGSFQAAYRKKTPVGLYTSSLLVGLERDEQNSQTGQRFIQNERITLTGSVVYSRLSLPNITDGSVVVRDPNGLPYFTPADYLLRRTGAFTEIVRQAAGNIPDGQTVRVDYRVVTATQAVWNTDRFDWSNRLALKQLPLALYANYLLDDENFASGIDPGNLDKKRDLLLGTELTWEGLVVAVEHEISDQILSPPYTADRVRATYSRPLGRNLDLSLNAAAEKLHYQQARQFGLEPGRDFLDSLTAGGALTAKLNSNTLLRFQSDLSETKGRENRTLLRNSATLEWAYGKLSFSLEARYDTYDQEQTTGTAAAILLSAKRRF